MHIDLSRDEANALRELLQEKVKALDLEINRTDSLRFKGELRNVERQLEKILGSVSAEAEAEAGAGAPKDWEARDAVTDEP